MLKEENAWIPKYSEYFAYVPIEDEDEDGEGEEGNLDDYNSRE